ncbi:MAG: EamA family transporter [bacterium]|nr:EamA family transporter [bacterium]
MSPASKFHWKATLALIGAILCWSAMPLFLRSFIHEVDSWTANGTRYSFALLLWSGPLIYFSLHGRVRREYWRWAIIPSIVNIMAQVLFAMCPYYLEPGFMMFLGRGSILFAITWSFILFPDELALIRSRLFWSGAVISISGFVAMNLLRGRAFSGATSTGLLILFAHMIFIGMYGVSVRYFMRGIDPWISFPIICTYTGSGLFVLMFLFGEPVRLFQMSEGRFGVLLFSAVLGIALAHTLYYYAINEVGVSISTSCSLTTPFLTSIGSYFIFHEVLTVGQWIAGLVIFCGAMLLLIAQRHLGVRRHPGPAIPSAPELEEFETIENGSKL